MVNQEIIDKSWADKLWDSQKMIKIIGHPYVVIRQL